MTNDELQLRLSALPTDALNDYHEWEDRLAEALDGGGRAALTKIARDDADLKALERRYYACINGVRINGVLHKGRIAIVDRRLAGPGFWNMSKKARVGLDDDLKELIKIYTEDNQRKSRPALKELQRDLRRGRPSEEMRKMIGQEEFDLRTRLLAKPRTIDPRTGLPRGCHITNLNRNKPEKVHLDAARQGLGHALAKYGPQILTTRVGLWVGSHYTFDDVLRDVEALWLSRNQIVRPQELGVMDFFSGDRFMVHRRPQFKEHDAAGRSKKNSVKEREMRFLVAAVLYRVGYSPRGTWFVTELGTAAVRSQLAHFLGEHSGGLIRVRDAGITGKEQAIAGYWGRGGGNPRHKARHEAHHNLLHNESASRFLMPTGHDRNPPEWMHGITAITEGVMKSLAEVAPKYAEMLAVPHPEYWQMLNFLNDIDLRIARRTDHNLEGYRKLGLTTVDYRLDVHKDEWLTAREFLALPESQQSLVATAASVNPLYRRPRQLSPREVFSAGAAELVRFPEHVIALMFCDKRLGDDLRESKRVNDRGEFDITDQFCAAGPDRMQFKGREVRTPTGEVVSLNEQAEYGVVLNPWDPDALWVYSDKGDFIGTAPRKIRLSPLDDHGIQHALGGREHEIKGIVTPLRDRHAHIGRELELLQEHNHEVLTGKKLSEDEKRSSRKQGKRIEFGRALARSAGAPEPVGEAVSFPPNQTEEEEIW